MPGVFYASMAGLIFMMYYIQHLFYIPKKQNSKPRVTIMGEAKIGGAWTLMNTDGKFETDQDYHGKFVIYYFGFCRCPDICPASLQKMASSIDIMKKNGTADKAAFLFISLDPDRDDTATVREYCKRFHSDIKGLILTNEETPRFLKNYKIYATKVPGADDNDYNLDHTSYMYIFDTKGKFMNVLGANLNYEELAETIEDHMKLVS
jgi:protein SCO1/2